MSLFRKFFSISSPKANPHFQDFFLGGGYLIRWLLIAAAVGVLAGSASALFLVLLDRATQYREQNTWIIIFLPLAGFVIGWSYHQWGKTVAEGNNLLLQEIQRPSGKKIDLVMAPLVMVTTVLTHLFGGSAGREGTAVQMGGALADQMTPWLNLTAQDRKILLICGISAGFSSVFGTPLAGAVFGLEVFLVGQIRYGALLPSMLAAVLAHLVTTAWGVGHVVYPHIQAPTLSLLTISATVVAGLCFALVARAFSWSTHAVGNFFQAKISYGPLRPALGGMALILLVWLLDTTKYIGLGLPTIIQAFDAPLPPYDFLLKLALTALTLGCGFKGGEVTPLFFIGATLGNALFPWVPLPLALLAAIGFVGVFAGAANTPLACTLMAIELFGGEIAIFAGLACIVSYMFSGHRGIYGGQVVRNSKLPWSNNNPGKGLSEL